MFRLVQLTGAEAGKTFNLNDFQSVGRTATNHIVVNDSQVSLDHAVIHVRGHDATLVVKDATALLLLNGQRIGNCSLRHGDVVTFGSTQFQFEDVEARLQAPPATAPSPAVAMPYANQQYGYGQPGSPIPVPQAPAYVPPGPYFGPNTGLGQCPQCGSLNVRRDDDAGGGCIFGPLWFVLIGWLIMALASNASKNQRVCNQCGMKFTPNLPPGYHLGPPLPQNRNPWNAPILGSGSRTAQIIGLVAIVVLAIGLAIAMVVGRR